MNLGRNKMNRKEYVLEVVPDSEAESMTSEEIFKKVGEKYATEKEIWMKSSYCSVISTLFRDGVLARKLAGEGYHHAAFKYWKKQSTLQSDSEYRVYRVEKGKVLEVAMIKNETISQVIPVSGIEFSLNISRLDASNIDWERHNERIRGVNSVPLVESDFKKEHRKAVLSTLTDTDKLILSLLYKHRLMEQHQIFESMSMNATRSYVFQRLNSLMLGSVIYKVGKKPSKYQLTTFGTEICASLFGVDFTVESGLRDAVRRM